MKRPCICRVDDALLAQCASEPIHIPGAIQPHGALVAIDPSTRLIKVASENTDAILGKPATSLIAKPLSKLFGTELDPFKAIHELRQTIGSELPTRLPISLDGVPSHLDLEFHIASTGELILEFERTSDDRTSESNDNVRSIEMLYLREISNKSTRSEPIENIFHSVTRFISQITDYDRVMLYKMDAEGHGEVVAETKRDGLEPFLGLHFPAADIPAQARKLYLSNRVRLLVDVAYQSVPLHPRQEAASGPPLDLSLSHLRSFSPVHLEYLENMGVAATLIISIVTKAGLWGLIACHHCSPKHVNVDVRRRCKTLAHTLSLSIEANESSEEVKAHHDSQIWHHVLESSIGSGVHWESQFLDIMRDTLPKFGATGFVLASGAEFATCGVVPSQSKISLILQKMSGDSTEDLQLTTSLARLEIGSPDAVAGYCGCMCLRVSHDLGIFLMWFRPETASQVSWAGDPRKVTQIVDGNERLSPRISFEKWVEEVRGESLAWTLGQTFSARRVGVFVSKRKVEDANRLKSQFLTNMSHEIRTPMTAILGYLDELDDLIAEGRDRAEAPGIMKTIRNSGTHLLDLINDILDLSKIESGIIDIERVEIDLLKLLADIAKIMQGNADTKGLQFGFEIIGSSPQRIVSDPLRVRQILLNLLGNAITFTNSGKITLTASMPSSTDDLLELRVSDTGCGISDSQLARLYKPFTQAESSTSRHFGGTGLGLDISRRFARMLGGDVVTENSAIGVGSVFCLTLAVGKTSAMKVTMDDLHIYTHRPPTVTLPTTQLIFEQPRVLVAEDGIDNRRLLQVLLRKVGIDVETVENGQLAVDRYFETLAEQPFDLILMDMQMPVLDGYQATRQLRERGVVIPILAITAHAMSGEREKCERAGCTGYLTKPIDRNALFETMASAIKVAKEAKQAFTHLPINANENAVTSFPFAGLS